MVRSTDEQRSISASRALGAIGPAAKEAYPDLRQRWMNKTGSSSRLSAFVAMTEIDPDAAWQEGP